MKRFKNKLTIEHLLRVKSAQIMIKRALLKSLIESNIEKHFIKLTLLHKVRKQCSFFSICKQNTRCLVNGRPRSTVNLIGLSRHALKQ